MWDTAGQERFRAVTRSYYRGAAGALLVFDVARFVLYFFVSFSLQKVNIPPSDSLAERRTSSNITKHRLDDPWIELTFPVILLVGNKSDLDTQRDVSFDEASKFAKANGLLYMETSAMTYAVGPCLQYVFFVIWHTSFPSMKLEWFVVDSDRKNIREPWKKFVLTPNFKLFLFNALSNRIW